MSFVLTEAAGADPPPVSAPRFVTLRFNDETGTLLCCAIFVRLSMGITVMLPAATLPLLPAFTACTGKGGMELLLPAGGIRASPAVINWMPLLVKSRMFDGISTSTVPLLVKLT